MAIIFFGKNKYERAELYAYAVLCYVQNYAEIVFNSIQRRNTFYALFQRFFHREEFAILLCLSQKRC